MDITAQGIKPVEAGDGPSFRWKSRNLILNPRPDTKKAGAIKSGWGERPPSNGDVQIDGWLSEMVAKIVYNKWET